jgi:hypothetical protein
MPMTRKIALRQALGGWPVSGARLRWKIPPWSHGGSAASGPAPVAMASTIIRWDALSTPASAMTFLSSRVWDSLSALARRATEVPHLRRMDRISGPRPPLPTRCADYPPVARARNILKTTNRQRNEWVVRATGGKWARTRGKWGRTRGEWGRTGGSGAEPGGSGAEPGGSGAEPGGSGAEPGGSGAEPGGSECELREVDPGRRGGAVRS